MSRPSLFGAAWWRAFGLAALWWLPAILLALAGLLLDRLRFRAALALGRALAALGLSDAARCVYSAERRRCERRMAALAHARGAAR